MFLNSKVKYGVKALFYFSQLERNKTVSASKISAELNVPKEFIAKIMQLLVYQGILKSKKGKGGGFYLANSPDKIKFENIFKVLGYKEKASDCLFDMAPLCKKKVCPFCEKWKEFINDFNSIIKNYSITGNLIE